MRKALSMLFIAIAITANAQDDFNRIRLEFNPSTMSYHGQNSDLGKITVAGFTLGYEYGLSLSERSECYLVAGAKLQYNYKSKVRPYRISQQFVNTRITDRIMDVRIPVNFMYRFRLNDVLSIEPYAGLNATCYLFGTEKIELAGTIEENLNIFDEDDMKEYGWDERHNRFLVGWQAGADLLISGAFTVGFSYGTDFTDFGNESHWTHWSLGVGFCF